MFWLWRFFDKSARECNHNHFCNECNNKEYASELCVSFSSCKIFRTLVKFWKTPWNWQSEGVFQNCTNVRHFTTMPFAWISHPIKFTPPSSSDLQYVLLTCFLVFAISILEYWFPLRQHSSRTIPKSEFTQSWAPLIPQHSLFAWIEKFSSRKWIKKRFVSIHQWIKNKSYRYLIPKSRKD